MPGSGAPVTFCTDSQEQVEDVWTTTTTAPGASDERNPDTSNIVFMLQLGLTKSQPPQQILADRIKTEHEMSPVTSGNGPDIQFENPSQEELSVCDTICQPKATSQGFPAPELYRLPTKHIKLPRTQPSKDTIEHSLQLCEIIGQSEEGATGTGIVVGSAEDTGLRVKKHDKTSSVTKQKLPDRSGQSKPKKRRSALLGLPVKVIAAPAQTPQGTGYSQRLRRTSAEQKKLFQCPQCPEAFVYEGNLLWHINEHNQKKVFQCPHCKMKFSEKNFLATHIRNSHP